MAPRKKNPRPVKDEDVGAEAQQADVLHESCKKRGKITPASQQNSLDAEDVGAEAQQTDHESCKKRGKITPASQQNSLDAISMLAANLQRLFPEENKSLFEAACVKSAMELPLTSQCPAQDLAIREFVEETALPLFEDIHKAYAASSTNVDAYKKEEAQLVASLSSLAQSSPPSGWFCPPALQNHVDEVMALLRWYGGILALVDARNCTKTLRESGSSAAEMSRRHKDAAEAEISMHTEAANLAKLLRSLKAYEHCRKRQHKACFHQALDIEEEERRDAATLARHDLDILQKFCDWYGFATVGLTRVFECDVGRSREVIFGMPAKVESLCDKLSRQLRLMRENNEHLREAARRARTKATRRALETRDMRWEEEATSFEQKAFAYGEKVADSSHQIAKIDDVRAEAEKILATFSHDILDAARENEPNTTSPKAAATTTVEADPMVPADALLANVKFPSGDAMHSAARTEAEDVLFDAQAWAAQLFPRLELPSYMKAKQDTS